MRQIFDETIKETLNQRLRKLEDYFNGDVIFHYGEIHPLLEKDFRDFIEEIKKDPEFDRNKLVVFLNTPGGSAETVEKMVSVIRFHYDEVYFVVPDYAMSAGTILCMSGDKIFMDYSSSLGPIDPQVYNGKNWVPALGYLDKVEELIKKSQDDKLTEAEFMLLQKIDLAELRSYEMARNLTIALLKEWLVKFKFKDWTIHSSTSEPVTENEKTQRANFIATALSNNSLWHSHGRSIGIDTLKTFLKLKIEDYSKNNELRELIRDYNDLICEHIIRLGGKAFVHSRVYF
ncbi:MAG: ATP-dependent Clp protease proteolytic subunit [Saprospiraceae bacterium]|nr:ATP-dependent Clp protease proteolytic subunit [Candidatus Defluviibacterium haderslevense]MBK7244470.1 ATP-dependent Clp protease proteolytic subunit [Candidatus Defluviibacterium haderslevense]